MKSIKTIHVVQHLAPGGLETLVLDLVRFSNHTNQTLIVSLEGSKQDACKNWPKLMPFADKITFLNKAEGIQLGLIKTLVKMFKHIQPDVVHTHHIGPLLYGGFAAKLAGVQACIHTEHDAWHLSDPQHRRLQHMALAVVKPHLVADAISVRDQLRQYFPHKRVTTILNGIDTKYFSPACKDTARKQLNLPLNIKLIGSAGRLEHVKGHDQLIKAMALLPKCHHLAIAGNGSQRRSLEKLTHKLGLDSRVHFLGRIDGIAPFYQALDVFCLPSRHEGYPLSAIEAQACNTPTAVTDVGSSSETLCPTTGKLIKAHNVVDMAASLMNMLATPTTLSPRTQSPRAFVCRKNEIRSVVTRYEALCLSHQQNTFYV